MSVYITDYIENPDIERSILGDLLSKDKETAEVILVWHQKIDTDYLNLFPNLKGVIRYGVGYDAIDLEAIKNKGVVFCNTPDYGTDEVSDTAIGMIMSMTRGISRYDYFCRQYKDNSWQENTITKLRRSNQLVLGVIGAGRIGGSILRKVKAIGFNLIFFDPYKERGYEKMLGVDRVDSLDELLEVSDIVSINTPLTDETRGMVNINFISKMKHGASLVNTARGEIIDNIDDFIEPLKSGKILNLGLDVLPEEPPKNIGLIALWRSREDWLDGRLIINPHTSYYSKESYAEMRKKASKNAQRIIENKKPFNAIIWRYL
jgi:lactate dehydrogenase-like 2-hydroxyacid dehydrogenase